MEGHEGDNDNQGATSRGHWRPEEDQLLRNLVERFGPKNWNTIAEQVQGRTGNQLIKPFVPFVFI
uniref:Uncharacterized protein n=1 Tax=Kalanchoe fedtschenkoi TaxID=63787 RepID=A0A7N0TYL5_KALFE